MVRRVLFSFLRFIVCGVIKMESAYSEYWEFVNSAAETIVAYNITMDLSSFAEALAKNSAWIRYRPGLALALSRRGEDVMADPVDPGSLREAVYRAALTAMAQDILDGADAVSGGEA